ncbi:MAG: DUF1049 domain-containing protein [Deltaproteobacteria bacterium]|nr:DUF1049 domain-containing protein [Deltaproteobacteria bacterium]
MRLSFLIVFIVIGGVGIFALQNQNVLQVKFLKFYWETSQSIVIMVSVIVGLIGGMLAMVPGSIRKWRKMRNLEKIVATLKKGEGTTPEAREN